MADKETVIKGLEECTGKGHCTECPYGKESQTLSCKKLLADVLSVVKEQEEQIENLRQTAQSMMEGVCLLKEQKARHKTLVDAADDMYAMLKERPEVVRCRDCKHRYYADNRIPAEQVWVCEKHGIDNVAENWFCADGEMKDGDGNG